MKTRKAAAAGWEIVEIDKKTDESNMRDSKNFRAKLLGLFYEELLKVWLEERGFNVLAMHPSIYKDGKWTRGSCDYLLKKSWRRYISEAKCWPAYLEGDMKLLTRSVLPKIQNEGSLGKFLDPHFINTYEFGSRKYGIESLKVDGKILFWWDCNRVDMPFIKRACGLNEIFSIRDALDEMRHQQYKSYEGVVERYRSYINDLFEHLLSSA